MKENKLILEFMGYPKIANDEDKRDYLEDCVKYHESWDWLMPVIEKIETLGYTFEKNYQPIDKDWQSLIVKGNDILYQEFNDDSLKSSYYVLVEFIKQYNNERNRSN